MTTAPADTGEDVLFLEAWDGEASPEARGWVPGASTQISTVPGGGAGGAAVQLAAVAAKAAAATGDGARAVVTRDVPLAADAGIALEVEVLVRGAEATAAGLGGAFLAAPGGEDRVDLALAGVAHAPGAVRATAMRGRELLGDKVLRPRTLVAGSGKVVLRLELAADRSHFVALVALNENCLVPVAQVALDAGLVGAGSGVVVVGLAAASPSGTGVFGNVACFALRSDRLVLGAPPMPPPPPEEDEEERARPAESEAPLSSPSGMPVPASSWTLSPSLTQAQRQGIMDLLATGPAPGATTARDEPATRGASAMGDWVISEAIPEARRAAVEQLISSSMHATSE